MTARDTLRRASMAYAMAHWQTLDFDRRSEVCPNLREMFAA